MQIIAGLTASMFLVAQIVIKNLGAEVFSSLWQLSDLHAHEEQMLDTLEKYVEAEETRLQQIKAMVQEKEKVSSSAERDDVGHPVNAYHLIKSWFNIYNTINDNSSHTDLQEFIKGTAFSLLTERDMTGIRRGLLRLQRTYNISTDSLADGRIRNKMSRPLSPDDCYHLGLEAQKSEDYGLALAWLQMALIAPEDATLKSDVIMEIAQTYFLMEDYAEALKIAGQVKIDPKDRRSGVYFGKIQKFERFNRTFNRKSNRVVPTWRRNLTEREERFERLCRGEALKTLSGRSGIRCRIRNPHTYYNWIKEEIFSVDPWVSLIHDVITDRENEMIKNMAIPDLHRSLIGSMSPEHSYVSEERICKVSWLWDHQPLGTMVAGISRRIGLITGYDTQIRPHLSSAEALQVNNYGVGGQQLFHFDAAGESMLDTEGWPPQLLKTGDRMATFMLYLSDVEAGGYTAFPRINLAVPPVKNAALFWYNVLRKSTLDERMIHAGCPVLLGEKWVANKWIREYGQEFRRPCGIHPNATDEELHL